MSRTVLVTAPGLAARAHAALESSGCRVLCVPEGGGVARAREMLAGEPVAGLIAWRMPVDAETIAAAGPSLRVVSRHGAGIDGVDVAAASARGIVVTRAPGANAQAVAELAIGLTIAVARSIAANDAAIRAGRWPSSRPGFELAGSRLGLVGFGAVARHVARIASAIGMSVRFYDPACAQGAFGAEASPTLDALLEQSDVLSMHCPLVPSTRNLIDAEALARLPRGAIVVNTARGAIVDETALIAALETGHVGGAGLDVFASEPLPADHRLRDMPQVVLSPHAGGSTQAAREASAVQAAQNVVAVLSGERPQSDALVNPEIFAGAPDSTAEVS